MAKGVATEHEQGDGGGFLILYVVVAIVLAATVAMVAPLIVVGLAIGGFVLSVVVVLWMAWAGAEREMMQQ